MNGKTIVFLSAALLIGGCAKSYPPPEGTALLRYSPGYCGWHVSGQKRLFEFLQPQQIGITLRESFLMQPLKSISGVMIAGPIDIHRFKNDYPFCERCETEGCRERIRALAGE